MKIQKSLFIVWCIIGFTGIWCFLFYCKKQTEFDEENRKIMNIYYNHVISSSGNNNDSIWLMMKQYIASSKQEQYLLNQTLEYVYNVQSLRESIEKVFIEREKTEKCNDYWKQESFIVENEINLYQEQLKEINTFLWECKIDKVCNTLLQKNEKEDYQHLNDKLNSYTFTEKLNQMNKTLESKISILAWTIKYLENLQQDCIDFTWENFQYWYNLYQEALRELDMIAENRNEYIIDFYTYHKRLINQKDMLLYEWIYR